MSIKDFQNGFVLGLTTGGVTESGDNSKIGYLVNRIDESEVLESTDGTAAEKVNALIYKSKTHNWFYDTYIKDRTSVTVFQKDTDVTTLPLFDLSHLTSAASLLSGCSNLEEVPPFDLSNCTSFYYTFNGLKKITTIPLINTSNSEDFKYTFYGCTSLTTIPQINTSKGTNFSSMFYGCTSLTTIPQINTSKGTIFSSMFYGCTALKEVPVLNTSSGTDFNKMFQNCSALETIHGIDVSSVTSISGLSSMFASCSNLKNYTPVGSIGVNFNMQYQHNLTVDSAKNIIRALVNYTDTENANKFYLYLSATVWELLDAEGNTAPNDVTWKEYVESIGWNY